jgi:GNAT superfamily N-acetyltransferase
MAEPFPQALLSASQVSRVRLRSAREGEGQYLPAIERSAGQLFRLIEGLSWLADAEDLPASFHERLIEAGTCWVAESGTGDIIGFLTAEAVPNALHVWEFSIAQQWQGHGIGRKLFEHVIEQARQWGSGALTLTTFCNVPWNAPFYAQLGFRIVSEPDDRLGAIIHQEGLAGFPQGSRCAMKLDLTT